MEDDKSNYVPTNNRLKTSTNDDSMRDILKDLRSTKSMAVINYGASWHNSSNYLDFSCVLSLVSLCGVRIASVARHRCKLCNQTLPAFSQLSNEFPKLSFVYADIDECPDTTQHIRYTPTFHFFKDGERVDEMFGVGEDRLRDRLWLHS